MLIRTMVLLAFVAVMAETILYGAAALARANFHDKERSAVRTAFAAAVLQAQEAAVSGAIPSPSATCAYADERGCALTVRTTIAASTPIPGVPPSSCPNGSCAIYEERNSHVAEGRASFTITEAVLAQNADVMMTRRAAVSFRTFAEPPYASLVGSIDATLAAIAEGGTGDDGGNATAGASTLIHVEYRQAGGTGPAIPADAWRVQDEHSATSASAWEY